MATEILSAIYAIRHIESGRLYVGSAVNYPGRWRVHLHHLRSDHHHHHHSRYLQNAWNKYGEDAFDFHVIQIVEAKHELLVWEQFYIDRLKPAFNASQTATSVLGIKRSAETREKLRLYRLGTTASPEARKRMSEARKGKPHHTPESRRKIGDANRGRAQTAESKAKLSLAMKGRKRDPATLENQRRAMTKTYQVTDPEGTEYIVTGLIAFCKEHGLCLSYMRSVARGRYETAKGWRCKELPKS